MCYEIVIMDVKEIKKKNFKCGGCEFVDVENLQI